MVAGAGQREGIEAEAAASRRRLAAAGSKLSVRRRAAAGRLRASVEACLAQLAMGGCRFDVRIGWEPLPASSVRSLEAEDEASVRSPGALAVPAELAAAAGEAASNGGDRGGDRNGGALFRFAESGLDRVEFLLAAGAAEPLRALGAVASGGESARVMLALKAAPALAMDEAGLEEEAGAGAGDGCFGA